MRFFNLKGWFDFALTFFYRFQKDRLLYAASALTFTSLLSIVPLMTVILGILSAFSVFNGVRLETQGFVFDHFVPATGQVVQQYLNNFALQTRKLSAISLLFLLLTAVLMIFTIEQALNEIWGVDQRRHGMSAWLRYWAMLTLAPILIGCSILGTSYLISLPWIAGAAKVLGIKKMMLESVPLLMQMMGLTFLYVVIPNCYVRWWHGLLGAVVASLFFELARKAFLIYIIHFPTYQLLYGALATIPIFLLWVYLSWVIILSGAIVVNMIATGRFRQSTGAIDGFLHAVLWLGVFWRAQQSGQAITATYLQQQYSESYQVPPESMLYTLQKANLIAYVGRNRYVFMRDFSTFTLAELYEKLPWKLELRTVSQINPMLARYFEQGQVALDKACQINLDLIFEEIYSSKPASH